MTFLFVVLIFLRVSKGVRELPGSFNSATSTVPSGKSLMYFGLFLASGVFFIFIAFTVFLPAMVLVPQKFAICFTLGCAMIVGSFFALKGPRNQLVHMTSKEVPELEFILHFAWFSALLLLLIDAKLMRLVSGYVVNAQTCHAFYWQSGSMIGEI